MYHVRQVGTDTWDDAEAVSARDAEDAAESVVQIWWDRGVFAGDHPENNVVEVEVKGGGEVERYDVVIDWDPVFTARRPRGKETT